MNRAIYAITTSVFLLLGTIAIAMPYQEAEAAHGAAKVYIQLLKNDEPSGGQYTSPITGCGTDCSINVGVPKKIEGKFNRWCDSNPVAVTVAANTGEKIIICEGKGPWDIEIKVRTTSTTSDDVVPHDSNVTVRVGAI